jgi:GNAT superfamily N-acetyltransferase
MTSIEIQPAQKQDIPQLTALLHALFTIEQDFVPDDDRQQRGLALLLQRPECARIVVARSGQGDIIGMASAQLVVSTAEGALSAWIEDVVVAAPYRRFGIGSQLLAYALTWASKQGATRAQLLCDMDNPPALSFYGQLGWQGTRLVAQRIELSRVDLN